MTTSHTSLLDLAPSTVTFREDVLEGLRRQPKQLPCKYLYDEWGCALFEAICDLPEYYLTRTELEIMHAHGGAMAAALGPQCMLIEYGSGSSLKTRILLDHLEAPAAYVPVDIARDHLARSTRELSARHPELRVVPVCADFTRRPGFRLPAVPQSRRVVYFPGSTIGNFEPRAAERLIGDIAQLVGRGGGLLIGLDLEKPTTVLEAAYNDARGVTAAFNLNLLRRINRELEGDFLLDQFAHRAFYDEDASRIEMHLVSQRKQIATITGVRVAFAEQETIRTELSHKYRLDSFAEMAGRAGFRLLRSWSDDRSYFAVVYCEQSG